MGQHKYPEPSLKIKLACFFGGVLLVAISIYGIVYSPPFESVEVGILGEHAMGKLLGLGLTLMSVPIWLSLRKKRQQP